VSVSRALFLDRDGVINHDSGYTSRIDDFIFMDNIFDLCRAAKNLGYLVIVVTNQAGIGRGYYSKTDFFKLTVWMQEQFKAELAPLTNVYYCPFHPDYGLDIYKIDSNDRKPNPGMFLSAKSKYGIDMEHSIMIGDKDSDMQAACRAGVGTRCHFIAPTEDTQMSVFATHKISNLLSGISLLNVSSNP